MQWSNS